ncbi:endo-alpha-N-acetylgalactosaminidase family protein [uncultured Victivallis sp.]|uniref:endo-alpha-N-acetylgalactosaminidase family protein n=1 Tax=uncultured Victivallis sp. TaxID=354118 RepID=UPI0025987FC3|nr:endo-alpha-N-acetylgalactosaminidase family protein [uncultured Victivallis sp.]
MHYSHYFNHYKDSVVTKIYLKQKNTDSVRTTPEQVMELLRTIHRHTGGMHQIAYLVGWQYAGHDSNYPSWAVPGKHCRSVFSDDPRESLRAMMREARRTYNADLSLHINMNDAYQTSPLWEEYLAQDLLVRNAEGELHKGGIWDGEQSYAVSHAREFHTGYAQKRILALLELLPELRETKTIHIDSFFASASPFHGITLDDDIAALNEIVDFWHAQGIDVSTEFLPSFRHIGYFPHVWHSNLNEMERLHWPPDIICGGDAQWNAVRGADLYTADGWMQRFVSPSGGTLYPEAWGVDPGYDLEGKTLKNMPQFLDDLFMKTLSARYLNRFHPLRHTVTTEEYCVEYSGNVRSIVSLKDQRLHVYENERCVTDDSGVTLELLPGMVHVYRRNGGTAEIRLPESWNERTSVTAELPTNGTSKVFPVQSGCISLELPPNGIALLK